MSQMVPKNRARPRGRGLIMAAALAACIATACTDPVGLTGPDTTL